MAFNVTHWIFAIKYWVLACKLQLIAQNQNPNKSNTFFTVVYYFGIAFNLVCGAVYGVPLSAGSWKYLAVQILQLCILVTCAFLADAFRRLKQVRKSDQAISRRPVILLSLSFGAYGVAQIIGLVAVLVNIIRFIFFSVELINVTFILSCVTLTMILLELIAK